MILSFLQTRTPPLLPSLHKIPHEPKPPNQGVDVSFADDIEKLRGWGKDNTETLGELLFAFFKKYGHDLDYEKTVISVREGTLLSKEEKGWQYLQNNRLCVEEPFNTSRNLGNTADDCSMRGIHMEFRKAHKILAEKASLADVCETYEFPPEETHHVLPPQAPSRPVTLSRSNSNHGRNRNGYAAGTQRGGRGYQFNNNRNPQNRRGSSGAAAFNQNVAQHQYYSPDILGYAQLSHDQLVAFQAQIQAHAVAQSQLAHLAQIQLHNQQNGTQSAPTGATSNEINSFLPTWPYFANLYNFSVFYPGFHNAIGSESSNIPTSPSHTSAAMADGRSNRDNDGSRTGLGRGNGRRTTAYTNGSRSHSQPPSLYPNNDYSQNMPVVGVPGSEDDGFGDHSSNGNPPTPPEEELDEYEGYYLLGGPLQPDLAVVDPPVGVEEEPFLEQKTVVDRQKRFSHEKLPPPMLGLARDTSCRDEVHQASPVIVNGSIPQTPYANSNSSGVPNGADSTTSRDSGSYTTAPEQRRQKYPRNAQKLLEVHNNQASRSEGSSSLPHHQQHSVSTSSPVPPPISSPSSSSETASECGSDNSPRLSPDLRQRAASRQLLWTNARTPLDAVKSRAHSSQEDLSIIPATEAPTPRKAPKPHANTHTKKEDKSATVASPRSNASREDPVPPTPAVEKKNGGGGRSKGNGGKPAGANTQQQQKNKDAKVEQKAPGDSTKNSQWISKRKTKKKKSHPNTKETAAAASVGKESERKGG